MCYRGLHSVAPTAGLRSLAPSNTLKYNEYAIGTHRGAIARGGVEASPLLHEAGNGVVTSALELLFLDLLLDKVLSVADGGDRASDGHDAVASARRERPFLGDLDVRTRHLLDLDEATASWTWNVLNA